MKKLRCHSKGQRRGGSATVDLAGKEAEGGAKPLASGRKLVKKPFGDEVEFFITILGLKVLFEGSNMCLNGFGQLWHGGHSMWALNPVNLGNYKKLKQP